MAELLQRLADADRIERRTEGRFRKQRHDLLRLLRALRFGFLRRLLSGFLLIFLAISILRAPVCLNRALTCPEYCRG